MCCLTLIRSKRAQKNEQKQSGNSRNSQNHCLATLVKELSKGCKDTVSPERLTKNHTLNCSTYEEYTRKQLNVNLCLFRALALHLPGNRGLDEKLQNCSQSSSR